MSFLRNGAINRVNLHSAIAALAQGAGGIFLLVFLLRAGVSVADTLLALAAIVAGRFALRPAILPLARRWGLKPLLILGTLGMAARFPLLAEVRGVDAMLLALCVVAAAGEAFYWTPYHAYFASAGDSEHRGRQIGAREALAAVVGIGAPLLGGWALTNVGPRWAFASVGLIQAMSALPLLDLRNVAIPASAPTAFRAARKGMVLQGINGWFAGCAVFVWQIALYESLGENLAAYGGAMALAGFAAAACALTLGAHVDGGHGRRAAAVAYAVAMLVVLLRAFSLGSPWLAVAANTLGALVIPLLAPALGSALYNLAKASPCALRFHIATESAWDVGCFAASLTAAALAANGASLSSAILLALPAIALGTAALWRYYGSVRAREISSGAIDLAVGIAARE
jgi:MFS transporter, DHA1 family, inner membrane transport protein